MKAVEIEGQTRAIGKPANWDDGLHGTCETLSVHDRVDEDTGMLQMISRWELEPGDLDKLQRGAPVYLMVGGQVHPVVCVYVGDPVEQAEERANG